MGALPVETGDDIVALNANDPGVRHTDDVGRQLPVTTGAVFAEKHRKLELADFFDQDGVQQTVVHAGFEHGREAAAVVAAVAHGNERKVVLDHLVIQRDGPVLTDAARDKVDGDAGKVRALAAERSGEIVDAFGDARVDARAGDRQALATVAVDQVELLHLPVPEVFRVQKLGHHFRTEVFEKVIAGADGDHRHGGIVKAGDAVCDLVGGTVAAAGIETDGLTVFGDAAREQRGVPVGFCQHARNVQIMRAAQRFRHGVNTLPAVLFSGSGIYDEDVLQAFRLQ